MKHAFTDFSPDATGTPRTAQDAYLRRLEMDGYEDDRSAPIRTPESLPHYADLRDGGLLPRDTRLPWPWFSIAAAAAIAATALAVWVA